MKLNRVLLAFLAACLCVAAYAAGDAKSQALALYTAIHKQNWKALYYLAAFSPTVKKQLKGVSAEEFGKQVSQGIEQGGNGKIVRDLFNSMRNIQVGAASVTGIKATVPTSVVVTVNGKTVAFKGLARMIKDAGAWKWDLTGSNDPEAVTAAAIQELIGKPVKQ